MAYTAGLVPNGVIVNAKSICFRDVTERLSDGIRQQNSSRAVDGCKHAAFRPRSIVRNRIPVCPTFAYDRSVRIRVRQNEDAAERNAVYERTFSSRRRGGRQKEGETVRGRVDVYNDGEQIPRSRSPSP